MIRRWKAVTYYINDCVNKNRRRCIHCMELKSDDVLHGYACTYGYHPKHIRALADEFGLIYPIPHWCPLPDADMDKVNEANIEQMKQDYIANKDEIDKDYEERKKEDEK